LQECVKGIDMPANFNILLEKGVPEGNNILLIGPPGIGKTIFCENFLNACLGDGISCIYVTIDKTPSEVKNNLQKGRTKLDNKNILIIDGYTWLIGKSREQYHIENLSNLTELNFKIISAASSVNKPFFLIFDSLSPLSLYNPENFVMKFLQLLMAKIKEWKGVGLYVVQAGVHSEEFYNTLGYLVDGIFDMKMIEEEKGIKRFFRVRAIGTVSHDTKWVPFIIRDDRTIEIQSESEGKRDA